MVGPMRVFIPTIGTVFVLAADWEFPLQEESRNHKFSKEFRLGYREWARTHNGEPPARDDWVTLPAGTVLRVDRIYIRKGGADIKEYDSVTFWCNTHVKPAEGRKLKRGRFWAKLADVNQMEVELKEEEP